MATCGRLHCPGQRPEQRMAMTHSGRETRTGSTRESPVRQERAITVSLNLRALCPAPSRLCIQRRGGEALPQPGRVAEPAHDDLPRRGIARLRHDKGRRFRLPSRCGPGRRPSGHEQPIAGCPRASREPGGSFAPAGCLGERVPCLWRLLGIGRLRDQPERGCLTYARSWSSGGHAPAGVCRTGNPSAARNRGNA